MKREIKFRAWNTHTRTMIDLKKITPLALDPAMGECDGLYLPFQDAFELMQFTGLKDKNEKEIYEGDIVKTGTDKLMVITWSKRFASFCIEREGWAFSHWFGEAFEANDCEVVGNIHENSELLTS